MWVNRHSSNDKARESISQYLARPTVSLKKLVYEDFKERVFLKTKYNKYFGENIRIWDAPDFIADLTLHIPCKGLHLIRYYGLYSSRTRGKWKDMPYVLRLAPEGWLKRQEETTADLNKLVDSEAPRQDLPSRNMRKAWAKLIAKVYNVDPLVCPECGSEMRIIAVITAPEEVKKILLHLQKQGRAPPGVNWSSLENA